MMRYFWIPLRMHDRLVNDWKGVKQPYLRFNVLETGRTHEGKADKKNVCLRIGQWSKTIIIFLAGGIPKTERDCLAIHHDIGRIVVED
jgi:hypothetical protein